MALRQTDVQVLTGADSLVRGRTCELVRRTEMGM